jgi:redox-sensitive bicupin YhaK (pirin superfamily)
VVDGIQARARVVMGNLWGEHSPVTCHSHTIYADIHLGAGGSMPIDAEADERGLYVAEGEAVLDGAALAPSTLYVLRPGTRATLRSERGGHVMLCGGAPLDGPRHVWWNFVSSSRERIRQAREDWKAGRFALPPDDHDEYIPLPEVPVTVSYP